MHRVTGGMLIRTAILMLRISSLGHLVLFWGTRLERRDAATIKQMIRVFLLAAAHDDR